MSRSPSQPNVVVIMSDEQRWDSLGANGNPAARTPNLDRLAADGVSHDGMYATYPLCCPSRMSMWTGLMPHEHHGFGNWRLLRPDLRDGGLIHPFRDAGYHTVYNGKWHVPGSTPSRFGFADVEATPAVLNGLDRGRFIEPYRAYAESQGYALVAGHIENLTARDVGMLERPGRAPYGTAQIALDHFLETWQTGIFLDQLERRPGDAPFFAVCSFNAPHFPMIVPEPYDRLVDPASIAMPANAALPPEGKPAEVVDSKYHHPDWPEAEWRHLIAHYLGLCALIDAQVGRVLDYLDVAGLWENTIVVFTSDHGDMLGSHSLNQKGWSLHYEEALRVPFIAAGPGIAHGRRTATRASLRDLVPTLGELCGVHIDPPSGAISFAPALRGDERWRGRPWVVAESYTFDGSESGDGTAVDPAWFDLDRDRVNLSLRTAEYRYIFRLHDDHELYDVTADPGERHNLAALPEHGERIRAFREIMAGSIEDAFPAVASRLRSWTARTAARRPSVGTSGRSHSASMMVKPG